MMDFMTLFARYAAKVGVPTQKEAFSRRHELTLQAAEEYIKEGGNPVFGRGDGSPLHYAAQFGTPKDVQTFLDLGISMELNDNWLGTPLHAAIYRKNKETALYLIEKGADMYALRPTDNFTTLFHAISEWQGEVAIALIQKGCKIDMPQTIQRAIEKELPGVVEEILKHVTDVDQKYRNGRTLLMQCVKKGNPKLVETLLQHRPDFSLRDSDDRTVYDYVQEGKNTEIITLLIEYNDVTLTEKIKQQLERDKISIEILRALKRFESESLENLVTPESVKSLNFKPFLYEASQRGNVDALNIFAKNGVDLNVFVNRSGDTPLLVAASYGYHDAVLALLQNGADPNMGNKDDGHTSLFYASFGGLTDTIETLIEYGADVTITDSNGRTALTYGELADDPEDFVESAKTFLKYPEKFSQEQLDFLKTHAN